MKNCSINECEGGLRMARRRNHHRGVMLLMVLVAILILASALVSIARLNLLAHRASIDAHLSIQQRWGMFSCQGAILPRTEAILQRLAQDVKPTRGRREALPSYAEDRVVLGGQSFELIVADEDAKANLNSLFDVGGGRACEQAMTSLLGPQDARLIQLYPSRRSEVDAGTNQRQALGSARQNELGSIDSASQINVGADQPVFRSWGEVFDLTRVRLLAGDDRYVANLTRKMSIFGTGKLNVFRANDETILAICKSKVSDGLAKRLIDRIRDSSVKETNLILEQTITNAKDRLALQQLLSSSSSSFSLWIEATNPRSRIQRLAVLAPNDFGLVEVQEFSFD